MCELTHQGLIKTGLIGRGIAHSRSPHMHMAEAQAQGLRLSYELFDLDAPALAKADLAEVLALARDRGFAGVNVTYPFKQEVIALLDALSIDARRLGAVNTVLFGPQGSVGHNTDWSGFKESFEQGLPDAPLAEVVQLGAGGAGAAVAYALLSLGVGCLTLIDRDQTKASELVAKLQAIFTPARARPSADLAESVMRARGLVNATPVGMLRHPGTPVAPGLMRRNLWVADVVYVPIETELLRAAREVGAATLDGGGMAVFQAAEAFQLFTGVEPDIVRMRERFLDSLVHADADAD